MRIQGNKPKGKNMSKKKTEKKIYNIARKFNSTSVLHIPIEHADEVNKLFVIPRVVNVSLAILSLLSASITQQYTMKRLPCVL